jgi:hypothetical protein
MGVRTLSDTVKIIACVTQALFSIQNKVTHTSGLSSKILPSVYAKCLGSSLEKYCALWEMCKSIRGTKYLQIPFSGVLIESCFPLRVIIFIQTCLYRTVMLQTILAAFSYRILTDFQATFRIV